MDKQWLLDWVKSLPDDSMVDPLEMHDVKIDPYAPEFQLPVGNMYLMRNHYTQKGDREYVIRIRCTTEIEGDFHRDKHGHEFWTNVKRIK
jgi:hypothetical protein